MSRVAAVQMTSCADVTRNLERAADLLRGAKAHGAVVAALPENFAFMGRGEEAKLAIAEAPGTGPIQSFLAGMARELGLWIVAGTVIFDSPGGNAMTSILLTPQAITKDNLNVVLDAGWIDKATLCQGVTAGSVAACG